MLVSIEISVQYECNIHLIFKHRYTDLIYTNVTVQGGFHLKFRKTENSNMKNFSPPGLFQLQL